MESISNQIESLQRSVAWMRRIIVLMIIVVPGVAVVAGFGRNTEPDTIRARRLEIVSPEGDRVVVLECDVAGKCGLLRLTTTGGKPMVLLGGTSTPREGVHESPYGLVSVFDAKRGHEVIRITGSEFGRVLRVRRDSSTEVEWPGANTSQPR